MSANIYSTTFKNTNDYAVSVVRRGEALKLNPGDTVNYSGPNPDNRAEVMPPGVVVHSQTSWVDPKQTPWPL